MDKINLHTWFSDRKLSYCPKHFVSTSTPVSDERMMWIYEKTQGRFYINESRPYNTFEDLLNDISKGQQVYFEDPQEAVLYELTWS